MDTTDLKIRAKKISELQEYDWTLLGVTSPEEAYENSYVIIGYKKEGGPVGNFKMPLTELFGNSYGSGNIDEDNLKDKINELIAQGKLNFETVVGPQGPKGFQGFKGEQGEPGVQGREGKQGVQGVQGKQGEKGDRGVQGLTGSQGPQGKQGDKGDTGVQGRPGIIGEQGPQGKQGKQGSAGKAGTVGDTGPQGPQGEPGVQGRAGVQGEKGEKGDKGNTGAQGSKGEKGDTGDQGPQGPTGTFDDSALDAYATKEYVDEKVSSTSAEDIEAIREQLNELESRVNQYHTKISITCRLTNVSQDASNPDSMTYDSTVTLKFTPATGYVMPSSVQVTGAEFVYSASNRTITLSNPTGDSITITVIGSENQCSLTFALTNITSEITSGELSSYIKNDIIEISLTPAEGYILPNSISVTNANNLEYNKDSGYLKIECKGTGNMKVTATAISNIPYSFGFAADGVTEDEGILGYGSNGLPNAILDLSKLRSHTIGTCPIDYGTAYYFLEDDSTNLSYGEDAVWVILPAKYFNQNTMFFLNDDNEEYKLIAGNTGFTITIDELITADVDNVSYVIGRIANEGISEYVSFTRK